MGLTVRDFMEVFTVSPDVVMLEQGQDLEDITPNGTLEEAKCDYECLVAEHPEYETRVINKVEKTRRGILIVHLKAA